MRKAYLISTLNSTKNSPSHVSEIIDGLEEELQTLDNDSAGVLTRSTLDSVREISQGYISSTSRALNKLSNTSIEETKDYDGNNFSNEFLHLMKLGPSS